jgi:osmotically-inducible protein OsmY
MKRVFVSLFFAIALSGSVAFAATPHTTLDNVEEALSNDPQIGPYKIEARYHSGLVTLKGEVVSEQAMYQALKTARAAKGVTGLRNRLSINPALASSQMMARPRLLDDKTIATNLMTRIESAMSPSRDFMIYVYGGEATFRGTAANHREIDRILSIALMTDGVTGIKNEMTVNGKAY